MRERERMFEKIGRIGKGRIAKVASALVLVLLGVIIFRLGDGKGEPPARPSEERPALTVRTATLREDEWTRTLSATGSVVPWQEAIISAQIQGLRIAEVKVSVGDWVRQGEVLVTLDNFARGSRAGGLGSVQGRIVAPDSGVISAANATVGSMSQPGQELFRLIRKGRLEWSADLTADELMLLHKGMNVTVNVGEGHVIKGKVRAVSPSVDPKTRYGYALITLPDSKGVVAGAFARGTFDISGGARKLQSLPAAAVLQRGEKTYVLVVGADNHVHERPVTVGQRKGDRVEIVDGLKANEPVVETGGAFLTEGDVVRVVKS
jgi:multidrug efflux pump subunit AcrA (membrane-fusion protein)